MISLKGRKDIGVEERERRGKEKCRREKEEDA